MRHLILTFILMVTFGVGTAYACSAFDVDNCTIDFLDTANAVSIPTPPLACNDGDGWYTLPDAWHCKNPVNSAFEPPWCLCMHTLTEASALYEASLDRSLPASIPNDRWAYVLAGASSDDQAGSCRQAIQDWKFCGDTVDGIRAAHDFWKGEAAKWKAKYETK